MDRIIIKKAKSDRAICRYCGIKIPKEITKIEYISTRIISGREYKYSYSTHINCFIEEITLEITNKVKIVETRGQPTNLYEENMYGFEETIIPQMLGKRELRRTYGR